MERSSKKEKGLVVMDTSVVIVGERAYMGINGNGKNTIKKLKTRREPKKQ